MASRRGRRRRSPPRPRARPPARGPVDRSCAAGAADARRLLARAGAGAAARSSGWAVAGLGSAARANAMPAASAASEAAPARRELVQGGLERLPGEIGPQLVTEHELRVRALPQQVVGDAQLAAGADHEIWVMHVGRIEVTAKLLLGGASEVSRRVEDLR